jgi:predicted transcriptional regulator
MDWDSYTKFVKAQGQYLTLVNSISEKKAKELERASQSHQKDYDKMKDFMLPDDKKDADYKKDMELLKEVYETELELAGDNAERKLQIEEAYRIAKLALNKKYDKQEMSGYKAVMNNIAEWMESDGGKNILGSINVVANGISDIASQVNSLMQANVDALTATIEKRYEKEISAAEGNSYRIAQLEKKKEEEITKMKAEENRKSFAIQVVQAVAQTATNAISAYGAALKIGAAGLVLAPIAAAMATAAGMIQIATIKKQQQAAEAQGYSEGGFTPDGQKDDAVGIVHAGEWVASQRLTKNPKTRPLLEALDYAQRNNTIGSIRMSDVSRSITAPILAASQQQAPTQSTIINNNYATAVDNSELSTTIRELKERLNQPFVTVNTVTGDMGIKKAQDEYSKLISNKSPKSRK